MTLHDAVLALKLLDTACLDEKNWRLALGSTIIDTACTCTVCGERWLKSYTYELKEEQVRKMMKTKENSCRPFRFGDGKLVYSVKKFKVPAKIGQNLTNCHINTEVVKVDIPLLLSKASLRKAGAFLDMENDRAVMFKQYVPLEFTSYTGLYCVDIRDKDYTRSQVKDVVLATTGGQNLAED